MQDVFVYYNIRQKCYSVKSIKTGRVIAHRTTLALRDCVFKVSEAGRQRVIREKRKNVHAGIRGEWISGSDLPVKDQLIRISYNPYKNKSFIVIKNKKAIHKAEFVILTVDGAYAII